MLPWFLYNFRLWFLGKLRAPLDDLMDALPTQPDHVSDLLQGKSFAPHLEDPQPPRFVAFPHHLPCAFSDHHFPFCQ